jgi:hypothetical protein
VFAFFGVGKVFHPETLWAKYSKQTGWSGFVVRSWVVDGICGWVVDLIVACLSGLLAVVVDDRELRGVRETGDGWELCDDALAGTAGVEFVGRKFAVDLNGLWHGFS